jgi:flagellar motor switch protein FliN/FliY
MAKRRENSDNNGDTISLSGTDLDAMYDISVDVTAVLGSANLEVSQLLKLGRGAVVVLNRGVNDPVEMRVNKELVARGEVVVVEDHLAIQLTEIVKSKQTTRRK